MSVDLSNLDVELLIDKSGSMSKEDCKGGKSRWQFGQEQVLNIARSVCKIDKDGIGVTMFNNDVKSYDGVTDAKVETVFGENSPGGGTETAKALKQRLDSYFERKAAGPTKNLALLVYTDGEPNDQQAVVNVIVEATKKMDRDEEIAIQFIQVGSDSGAAKYREHLYGRGDSNCSIWPSRTNALAGRAACGWLRINPWRAAIRPDGLLVVSWQHTQPAFLFAPSLKSHNPRKQE